MTNKKYNNIPIYVNPEVYQEIKQACQLLEFNSWFDFGNNAKRLFIKGLQKLKQEGSLNND
jgi:hypothetical protein